jgi:phospholipid/cholesterol/gamma-HCH transport system substrate-binding protein
MSSTGTRDTIVGLFVLAGLAAIAYLSIALGGLSYGGPGGLVLYADFDELGGLNLRAPVVVSGVKVGQVKGIRLGDDYRARVTLDVDASLELPIDTSASIVTAGVLGDRYVSLQLGGEEEILRSGDDIAFVESAVILERLIGQFIHNTNVGDE